MFYALLKNIFKVALWVFFRRIEVRNKNLIPGEGPLLIVSNHPNTLMDPLAIAACIKQEVYFIAKSTLFNSPFNKWLLQKLNLIPVYRREDGVVSADANADTFRQCFTFLNQQGTLLIFPEGTSYNERCLRPLKTGAARIALGTEAQTGFQSGLQLLPVGLNYTDPTRFRGTLFINVGVPIRVADYAEAYTRDPRAAIQALTNEMRSRLEDLLVTIASPEEDKLVERIRAIYKNNLAAEMNLAQRQEDKFVITKAIADSILYFNQQEPARVSHISREIHNYYLTLKKLGLQDKFLNNPPAHASLFQGNLSAALILLLGFPVFVWGLVTNYIPYFIPAKVAHRISEEEEFRAPIMMTTGIFTFGIFYALFIGGVWFWSNSGWGTLVFALSLPVSGLFALQYSYRLRLTRGYLKFLAVFYRRSSLVTAIRQQRQNIIRHLEEAKVIYLEHLAQNSQGSTIEPATKKQV
ncbi:MAG: hypothetical protein JWQ14_2574 [Adhaeribacter sp.]|nr:hypothetical protein [Adhaeribacter sp.]